MAELLQYKCPCCAGALEFDATAQAIKCPYCDTEFSPETFFALDNAMAQETKEDMHWDTQTGNEWQDGETDGMVTYSCNSCGGEIVGDEHMGATSCPFCGNPVVVTGKFMGELRPDCIIPFKLDKNAAKEAMKRHLVGKKLLPKVFKDENHLEEIKGIYVPFWLFDADADASMRYKGSRIRSWSDSRYHYTETSYYAIFRSGKLSFAMIPADGSTKLPDDLMESIEPYDYREAIDFNTVYLSGYFADKYDQSAEDNVDRINARARKSVESTFAATVQGYSGLTTDSSNIRLSNGKAKYALLPVWLLVTDWNGEKYTFAMNGQTGKFVGNLPMDKKAYWRSFFSTAALVTAITACLMALLNLV
ncbi:MAG: hypothetical protein IKD37_05690 [Clostridia bacterium]|nr:hypothetical protein [Clostridia bacterium]